VVNLVSSSVEPVTKVADLSPSSIDPTPPLRSASQVVDPFPSSIDPTPPLWSEPKVVDSSPSLVNPTLHSKNEDVTHVYLINIDSPGQGGTLSILIAPPSSTQMNYIYWNNLTEPHLPSYVHFQTTMQV
jgi:hypothetical protein